MNTRKLTRSAAFKGAAFSGILDELNIMPEFAFSIRRLTGTSWVTDDVIMRLRRSSDNAEADFSYSTFNTLDGNSIAINATAGDGDNLTTWAGADTLYIVEWYNQSTLGGYVENLTTSSQPIFDLSNLKIVNNLSTLAKNASIPTVTPQDALMNYVSIVGAVPTINQRLFIRFTTSGISQNINYLPNNTTTMRDLLQFNTLNGLVINAISVTGSQDEAIMSHYHQGTGSNNVTSFFKTFSKTATYTTTYNTISDLDFIFNSPVSLAYSSELKEFIYCSTYDSSDFIAVRANQSTYYGLPI